MLEIGSFARDTHWDSHACLDATLAVTAHPHAAGRVADRKVLKRAFCSSLSPS